MVYLIIRKQILFSFIIYITYSFILKYFVSTLKYDKKERNKKNESNALYNLNLCQKYLLDK